MMRFSRLLRAATIAVAISACGGGGADTTGPVVVTMDGTWNLVRVNDKALPFVITASDPKLELLSKQFVITTAGTYTSTFSVRATDLDGTVTATTRTDGGTVSLAADFVTLKSTVDGTTVTGAISRSALTIVSGEFTQVFARQ